MSITVYLAKLCAPYFTKPYTGSLFEIHPKRLTQESLRVLGDAPNEFVERKRRVYRPNHGLAHSVRQGLLALDVLTELTSNNLEISNWVRQNLKQDKFFASKIQFVSCFQRSGRDSEISESLFSDLYHIYENRDKIFFTENAIDKKIFSIDLEQYRNALSWNNQNNIARVIHSAHLLDLRRMPHWDRNRIEHDIIEQIGIDSIAVERLWLLSGKYLHATGDREINKEYYSDRFFELSNNPELLANTLREVRNKHYSKLR